MSPIKLDNVSKMLTEETLENAFKLKTRSKETVLNTTIKRAAPAGEGLLGAVYRINVVTKNTKTSFVVKGLVEDLLLRKSIQCAKFFAREVDFFAEVLPILIDVQKSLGAKECIQNNIPKCYGYHKDGKNDFLIIEDLLPSGFKPIPSENPSLYQRNESLKTLAHLHAVSIALRHKRANIFNAMYEKFPEIYYADDRYVFYKNYLQSGIDVHKEVVIECETPTSVYFKKFFELINNDPFREMQRLVTSPSDHMVINHGDAWCPNFFCSTVGATVFDFQIFRFSSPAIDLFYFIVMCINSNTTRDDIMGGFNVYYSALDYYLTDMNLNAFEIFPRSALDDELKKYGKFAILAALTSIPLVFSDRCDVLESFETKFHGYETIPLEQLWKFTPLKSEYQKKCLLNVLHIVVDMGFI